MGSTSRSGPVMIDHAPTGACEVGHDSDQRRRRLSGSASDAHSNRGSTVVADGLPRGTDAQVYSPRGAASAAASAPRGPESGRMSMRQPVSRAASRAFWPSRPMARDNW